MNAVTSQDYQWLEDEYVRLLSDKLKLAGSLQVELTALDCWLIISALQLASKHPETPRDLGDLVRHLGDSLTGYLLPLVPEMKPLIEDGWINPGTCRVCGCTDDHACPNGCSWVEVDLCSRCSAPTILAPSGMPVTREGI